MHATTVHEDGEVLHLPFWQADPITDQPDTTMPGGTVWRLILGNQTVLSLHPVHVEPWHWACRRSGQRYCWLVLFEPPFIDFEDGWHAGEFSDLDAAKEHFIDFWRDNLR